MNIKDKRVIKVVKVVEIAASLGIFKRLLLTSKKLILATIAKLIANINFQFNNKFKSVLDLSRLPDIKLLSPKRTIEKAELKQYINIQNIISKGMC
ncbi:MAG: hypothetical protein WCL56_01830 [Sediminibacterium sp.]